MYCRPKNMKYVYSVEFCLEQEQGKKKKPFQCIRNDKRQCDRRQTIKEKIKSLILLNE